MPRPVSKRHIAANAGSAFQYAYVHIDVSKDFDEVIILGRHLYKRIKIRGVLCHHPDSIFIFYLFIYQFVSYLLLIYLFICSFIYLFIICYLSSFIYYLININLFIYLSFIHLLLLYVHISIYYSFIYDLSIYLSFIHLSFISVSLILCHYQFSYLFIYSFILRDLCQTRLARLFHPPQSSQWQRYVLSGCF